MLILSGKEYSTCIPPHLDLVLVGNTSYIIYQRIHNYSREKFQLIYFFLLLNEGDPPFAEVLLTSHFLS